MPNTKIAFLDQFHPDIYTAIARGMANAMSYLSGGDLPAQDVVKLPDNAPV